MNRHANLFRRQAALGAAAMFVTVAGQADPGAQPAQNLRPQASAAFFRTSTPVSLNDDPPAKTSDDPVAAANPIAGAQELPSTAEQAAQLLTAIEEATATEEENTAPTEITDARPWRLTPQAALSSVYDDNIFIAHTGRLSDWIIRPSAGFELLSGDVARREESFLQLDYRAGGVFFLDHRALNSFEQSALVQGQSRLANLTLGIDSHYQDYSNESIDLGNRDRTRALQNLMTAKYDLSEKTFLEADFGLTVEDYASQIDSTEYVFKGFVGYKATSITALQVGAALGQLQVSPGGVQDYQQVLARLTRTPSEKLSLTAEGGVEFRQFPGSVPDHVTPVFLLNGSYEPVKETMINLSVYRRVESSALLAGQDYIHTGVSAGVSRKFNDQYVAALAGGFEQLTYESAASSSGASREDHYFFVEPSLGFQASRFCETRLFCRLMQDSSNFESFSFRDRQIGVEIKISF